MSRFIVLYSFIVLSCKFNHFEHFRPLCPENGVVSSWSQTRRTQTRRRRTRTRRTRWTAPGTGSPGTRGSNCDENIDLILACTPPSSHYSASVKYLPSTIYYPFTSYQKTKKVDGKLHVICTCTALRTRSQPLQKRWIFSSVNVSSILWIFVHFNVKYQHKHSKYLQGIFCLSRTFQNYYPTTCCNKTFNKTSSILSWLQNFTLKKKDISTNKTNIKQKIDKILGLFIIY